MLRVINRPIGFRDRVRDYYDAHHPGRAERRRQRLAAQEASG
jgi:hypothetical protein